jgi:hypothetical protein
MTTRYPQPTESQLSSRRGVSGQCAICLEPATLEFKITYDFVNGVMAYAYARACAAPGHVEHAQGRLVTWSKRMRLIDALMADAVL